MDKDQIIEELVRTARLFLQTGIITTDTPLKMYASLCHYLHVDAYTRREVILGDPFGFNIAEHIDIGGNIKKHLLSLKAKQDANHPQSQSNKPSKRTQR